MREWPAEFRSDGKAKETLKPAGFAHEDDGGRRARSSESDRGLSLQTMRRNAIYRFCSGTSIGGLVISKLGKKTAVGLGEEGAAKARDPRHDRLGPARRDF